MCPPVMTLLVQEAFLLRFVTVVRKDYRNFYLIPTLCMAHWGMRSGILKIGWWCDCVQRPLWLLQY